MEQEAFYSRDDVALKGFAKFFSESAKNERERAERWVEYQSLRGGRHVLQPIGRPTKDEWDTPLAAMEYALALEKEVNQVDLCCVLSCFHKTWKAMEQSIVIIDWVK